MKVTHLSVILFLILIHFHHAFYSVTLRAAPYQCLLTYEVEEDRTLNRLQTEAARHDGIAKMAVSPGVSVLDILTLYFGARFFLVITVLIKHISGKCRVACSL